MLVPVLALFALDGAETIAAAALYPLGLAAATLALDVVCGGSFPSKISDTLLTVPVMIESLRINSSLLVEPCFTTFVPRSIGRFSYPDDVRARNRLAGV